MNINEEIKKVMAAGIDAVLHGQVEFEIDLPITPKMVEDHLKATKFKRGDLDTNGWQYDWWLPFTKGGLSYTASGSGYYGKFRFAPTEE